jgi:tRNA A-37 threonylcarbamoyl transferase component Bud32/tetratricopeptide (TPR) repeat protein
VTAIKCGITFQTVGEFRATFVAGGETCFVPYPDEVEAESVFDVDVTVDQTVLQLRGVVVGPDFDEAGNIGVGLRLDDASREVIAQFREQFQSGTLAPALFSTTRTRVTTSSGPVVAGPPEEKLAPGFVVGERFRIESHLATGGMGEVYRAEHILLKRPVALKMLRRELSTDPEMWSRFEREAQLVSQLENPHIVRVFDFGKTDEGQLFLAMEYVEGDTLDQRLEKGPLDPARAVEILTQVLDGLAEAHNLGVVHRDLKPPNIILGRRREGGERAKILDFGIARFSDTSVSAEKAKLTQVGVVVGTPAYLSPEQALADELDHRTDIYAMGCVAYELLTGRPPFIGGDLRKIISAHLTSPPQPLTALRPELGTYPALGAAVLRALAKDKELRFQNVLEFSQALRLGLSGPQPVGLIQLVPPPSAPRPPTPAAEWEPAPAPLPAPEPVAVPAATGRAADDFFAATATAAPTEPAEGVAVRVEVLGPPPKSEAASGCLAVVTEVMVRAGAFFAARDEEGMVFGFTAREGNPSGRAAQALISARETLALASVELKTPPTLRALALGTRFPLAKDFVSASRAQLARARANTVWVDQRLTAGAVRVGEVLASDQKGLVALGPRRLRRRVTPDLIARKSVVGALERRLDSLQQGVVASLFVTGPGGSGHTTLAHLLATVARKRGALALCASGIDEPYGLLTELLCSAVNVEVHERARKLPAALEALPIADSVRQAALVMAGVQPSPALLTAGQAAHALRVVLRAVSMERPMVVIGDGLQGVDTYSREAFLVMAERPASRELLVGFGTSGSLDGNRPNLPVLALPPLSQAETQRLLTVALGQVAGPGLTGFVLQHAQGLPGTSLDLLTWLDESGLIALDSSGALELTEPKVALPAELLTAVWSSLPSVLRHALLMAASVGERFEPSTLKELVPAFDTAQVNAMQALGLFSPSAGKRLRLRSQALRRSLQQARSLEAQAARRRCVEWLIARGKTDPTSVEPVELAKLLSSVGDGVRGAPVWKHAVDVATQRRDLRAGREAWLGFARALALVPQPETQLRLRVDALARAAAQSILIDELTDARELLAEASVLASGLQPPSPDFLLVEARLLRLEGRRVKAAEVVAQAEAAAQGGPMYPLVLAELGEAREVEGDLAGALQHLEAARQKAHEVRDFGRWHGEVELQARLEARLATVLFAQRDAPRAKTMLESSLARWRQANWPWAEARVLSTLGTVFAFDQQFPEAAAAYEAAGVTAARAGDLQFQVRAMLQQAKALRRLQGSSAAMRSVASDARKLCLALGWEQGRLDATALLEGK